VNGLQTDDRINAVYLGDEMLTQVSQNLQENASSGLKAWAEVHVEGPTVDTAKVVSGAIPDLSPKRAPLQSKRLSIRLPPLWAVNMEAAAAPAQGSGSTS
jgi:hypothetical protein